MNNKVVNIDFMFLDLSVCTRCQGTQGTLDEALETTTKSLSNMGYQVKVNKVHIQTAEQAVKERFQSSPTIRVNGNDIQMEVKESYCSTCSSLTDAASVDCRLWLYKGKEYSVPPKEMIVDAVMSNIDANKTASIKAEDDFILPDNLMEYFAKKEHLCANVKKTATVNECDCEESHCC